MSEVNDAAAVESQALGKKAIGFRAFGVYFQSYMSAFALFAAAAPIPVTKLHLIPTFESQRGVIAVLAPLLSFLCLAYAYFSREALARAWYQGRANGWKFGHLAGIATPLLLILACALLMFLYLGRLESALEDEQMDTEEALLFRSGTEEQMDLFLEDSETYVIENSTFGNVPEAASLIFLQVGFFVTAELAFAIMALREYISSVVGPSERELLARAIHQGPLDAPERLEG